MADRYQQVTINGEKSSPALVTSGVPQGTVLAPLLFLCYILNDITQDISCKIKLYADDVLIYNTIAFEVDCRNLQRDLNLLQDWAMTWKMCFKCEFLRLTNKKNIIKFQYSIQGNNIQEVHQVKYLGVLFLIIIKLALQHAHIKLGIMTCASTITLCMLEGMLASSASTLKVYNVH